MFEEKKYIDIIDKIFIQPLVKKMRQKKENSKKNINKRNKRKLDKKIKKVIYNCMDYESWKVIEHNRKKSNLINYPKIKRKIKLKKGRTVKRENKKVPLTAPDFIDYYNARNFELTNKFIDQVKDCAGTHGRRVFIDFSKTSRISAAAMLSFLAEVDVLIKKSAHGINAISFSHPKEPKIEGILKQVGFYDLLKKEKRETEKYDDVNFWKYTSGNCSEPMLAKEMFIDIKKELEIRSSKRLYRGFTEAMSNSVEHAYIDDKEHSEEDKTAKWWTFAGIKDNELVVVICDKGVGIPSTLPKTQGVTHLNAIFERLGFSLSKVRDSSYIKAATSLTHTRTGKSNRGKGLTDIKSVIDTIGQGGLSIFSNHGCYAYKSNIGSKGKSREIVRDYKSSVCGTIVEWTIPCEVEDKSDEDTQSS